jgi:hypothetical protein
VSRRALSLAAVAALLSGCFPLVTEPLSDPNKAEPDKRLIGKWDLLGANGREQGFLVIDSPVVKGNPNGLMRAQGKGGGSWWFFSTTIGKRTYATAFVAGEGNNITFPDFLAEGAFERWNKGNDRRYKVDRYVLDGDVLTVDMLHERAMRGLAEVEKESDKSPVFKTPPGWFAKHLEQNGSQGLFFGGEKWGRREGGSYFVREGKPFPPPPPDAIDGVRTFGTWVKFADSAEAAVRQARADGRPALLIHSPGDWDHKGGPGGEAERLRTGAFADPKVGEYLNDKFVVAAVRTGPHPAGQSEPVVSYFCRVDGAVLHAVVGSVEPEQFRREAEFAIELNAKAAGRTDRELVRGRYAVRNAQFDRLPVAFRTSLSKTWLPGLDPPEPVSDRALRLRSLKGLSSQDQISLVIAAHPLAPVENVHRVMWPLLPFSPPDVDRTHPPFRRGGK